VRRGDTLVLCSDGLSGQVRGEEIAQVVHEEPDLVSACRRLIEMANERGGPDNITVIVARFEGTGLQVASQQDEVGHRVFRLADSEPTATTPVVPMSSVDTLETPARRSSGASVRNGRPTPVGTPAPAALDPRRSRGAVIAGVLLLTLLAGGAWFVWRAAHKLTTRTSAPASTATDSTAAKAR
jgi:PPM family protein phosphatase